VSITFKQWGGGNLGGQFRYSSQTSYDLAPAAQNITESNTQEISIQGSFNKTGFEIPLFGYALSNDLDISFTYGISKNSRRVYDLKSFKPDGTPLEGSSRTTLEPRLRYTLSAKVTASVYYKYTKLAPDAAGSRIPGSTTNEGGFDVRVQISQ
jgi:cell surface protein SprA